ncbi:SLAM family member 7 isoform X2 [Carlito syrichta]|uniref:SLAM family member 7 isoform X2 n=1 Tax=Carlito syrichta TaxID=1868482 RepID=A0A3Q0E0I9_CARSF|nr:SLAM family member 7 isoform X2 [Carlito syrichta]
MAGSPTGLIHVFLLCQFTASATSGAMKELVGAIGGSVTFPLTFTEKQIDSIVWSFNRTTLITIQPGTESKNATVIVTSNRNRERVDFSGGGYSLKLNKLRKNDSGSYSVQIHSSSSQFPSTQEYMLHVYEQVSKPKVTVGLQSNKNGTCMTNLTCYMEREEEDVTYSWETLGQTVPEFHNGPILSVSWRMGGKDTAFICIVRNPISNSSSSPILTRKFCEGGGGPDSLMVILILLLGLILLSLLLVGIAIWCLQKDKEKENCPNGRSSKYALFHCADSKKDGESQLTTNNARHTKTVYL